MAENVLVNNYLLIKLWQQVLNRKLIIYYKKIINIMMRENIDVIYKNVNFFVINLLNQNQIA